MHHDPEFCRGIAMVLQGESLKASRCVTHGASLGVLRERMVARFIRDATPARLKLETGLVHSIRQKHTSRQCDLLAHDASRVAPLYRWDEFVIVDADATEAVIEVKTTLNQNAFDEIRELQDSVVQLTSTRGTIPVFTYTLDGVTCNTFMSYVATALRTTASILAIPNCMVVQSRHYLAVRPVNAPSQDGFRVYVVDLSHAPPPDGAALDGLETGAFLEIYKQAIRSRHDAFDGRSLEAWFERVRGAGWPTASITMDGTINASWDAADQFAQAENTAE